MHKYIRALLTIILIASVPTALLAQSNSDIADRMDKLQRDVLTLQRQIARGEPINAPSISEEPESISGNLEVRLSTIEEQMRVLRGQIEEVQHQNRQLSDNFDKFRKDSEFRFNEI